jgi:hypothetical protein
MTLGRCALCKAILSKAAMTRHLGPLHREARRQILAAEPEDGASANLSHNGRGSLRAEILDAL